MFQTVQTMNVKEMKNAKHTISLDTYGFGKNATIHFSSLENLKEYLHTNEWGKICQYDGEKLFKSLPKELKKYKDAGDLCGWLNSDFKVPYGEKFEPYDTDEEDEMINTYGQFN